VSNFEFVIAVPYGEDCEIISPAEVRDRFAQKVQRLAEKYRPI
jgi:predicted DNA-binding transcriptional regulator YafY